MTQLSIRTDGSLIPSSDRSVRHVLLTVEAPVGTSTRAMRAPVDVAFVLDRSGSMQGDKITLAREAIGKGLSMLSPADRFAVVVYDDRIDVVAALGRESRERTIGDLAHVDARGTTDLSGGWLTGCMQLADGEGMRDIRKCLLLSDGHANRGITEHDELARHAAELRERGILTSTFGVGDDFDEELMTAIAQAGGGQAYYIEHAAQTLDLLTSELGETLDTVLRDVTLRLRPAEGMSVQVLSDFSLTLNGPTPVVKLGNMVSGQSISVLLRVDCPAGQLGQPLALGVALASREEPECHWQEAAWTYAEPLRVEQQPRNSAVDAEVAKVDAARARREALRYSRRGDYERARATIFAAAASLAPLSAASAEAREEIDALNADVPMFARAMEPAAMKRREYRARAAMASRLDDGKAQRSEPGTLRGK